MYHARPERIDNLYSVYSDKFRLQIPAFYVTGTNVAVSKPGKKSGRSSDRNDAKSPRMRVTIQSPLVVQITRMISPHLQTLDFPPPDTPRL